MIEREEAELAIKEYVGYLNYYNVIRAMPKEIEEYLEEKKPKIMKEYHQYISICNVLDKEPLTLDAYLMKIRNREFS